jgi:hypothetical protein
MLGVIVMLGVILGVTDIDGVTLGVADILGVRPGVADMLGVIDGLGVGLGSGLPVPGLADAPTGPLAFTTVSPVIETTDLEKIGVAH